MKSLVSVTLLASKLFATKLGDVSASLLNREQSNTDPDATTSGESPRQLQITPCTDWGVYQYLNYFPSSFGSKEYNSA